MIEQRSGEVVPAKYGAGKSLRELAASNRPPEFFQEADALRYMQVVEQTVFRAVTEFLAAEGYSATTVLDVARAKVNNHIDVQGGDLRGATFGIGQVTRRSPGEDEPS